MISSQQGFYSCPRLLTVSFPSGVQTMDSGHWVKGWLKRLWLVQWLPCIKPRHGGNYSCYTEIGVVSSSLCQPSLCRPALFQSASWLIHELCNLCSNQDRIIRPMCTLFIPPQLLLKVTSYHNLSASKPWTHLKLLENGHNKTSWFSFENLYIWTSLAEEEVIQMSCSTAQLQGPWLCRALPHLLKFFSASIRCC